MKNRSIAPYYSTSKIADWETTFPTLLPNGKGGTVGQVVSVTLREWIRHVVKIDSRKFHCNIPFVFYSNFILRKHQITGVSAFKPVGPSVSKAVSKLVRISKSQGTPLNEHVPDSTLRSLTSQVYFHAMALPGSIGDMARFRKHIFSMMSEHGPPTFFLTVSSADSVWPETFFEISVIESHWMKQGSCQQWACQHVNVVKCWQTTQYEPL